MDSIINDRLPALLEAGSISAVFVSSILDLYFDKDMWWGESFQLIKHSIANLELMARRFNAVIVATNFGPMRIAKKRALNRLVQSVSGRKIGLFATSRGLKISVPGSMMCAASSYIPVFLPVMVILIAVKRGR